MINVNTAINTWNEECAAAKIELAALEATLKADYNKYVDSLSAYLEKLKIANDIRAVFVNQLGIEDVTNTAKTRENFLSMADAPIENKVANYLLDRDHFGASTKSITIASACDADKLIERKSTPLLVSIHIATEVTKLEYLVGETLDLEGIFVIGTYNNGTSVKLSIEESNVIGFDSSLPVAYQMLTVIVDGFIDTFYISVAEAEE